MSRWGIRYLVIALGDLRDKATDEDVEGFEKMVQDRLGPMFTITSLSERASDRLTITLLQERGAL